MPRPATHSATAAATAIAITNAEFEDAAGIAFGDENGDRPGAATIDKKTLGAWRFGEEFAKPFQRSLLEERPIPPWSMTRPQLFFLSLLADLSKLCTLTESDIAVVREYVHAHMKTRRSVSFMHGDSAPLEEIEHAEWTLEVRAPRQISSVLMACDGGPPMIVPQPSAKTAAAKEMQAQKDAEEAESAPAPTPRGPAHGVRLPLLPEPRPTATTAEDDAKTRPPPAPATAVLPAGALWFKVRMEPSARPRSRLAHKFSACELVKVEFHLPSSPAAAMDDVAASATGGDNCKAPTIAAWSKSLHDYVSKPSKTSLAAFLDSCDDHRASTLAAVVGQPLRLSFDARQVWEPVCCDAQDVVVRGDAMPTTTLTYASVPADRMRRWAGLPAAGPALSTAMLDLQIYNTPSVAVRRLKTASDVRMIGDLPHGANQGCGRISVSLMSKLVAVYKNQMKKQQQLAAATTKETLRDAMRRVDADLPPKQLAALTSAPASSAPSALEVTWRGVRGTVVAVRDDEIGPAGDDKERVFFTRSMVRLDMPAEAAEASDRCEVLSQLGIVAVAAHEPVLLSHELIRLLDANRAVVGPPIGAAAKKMLSTTAGSRRSLTNNNLMSGTVSRANSQRSSGLPSAVGVGEGAEGAQDDDGDIDFDDPALIAAAGAAARDRIGSYGNEDIDIDDRPTSFDGNYQGTSKRQSRRSSVGSHVLGGGGGTLNSVAAAAAAAEEEDSEREHDRLEALLTRWLLVSRPDVAADAKTLPGSGAAGGSLQKLLTTPEVQSAFLRRLFGDSEGHDDPAGEKHPRVRRRFVRHPAIASYLLQLRVPLPNATNAMGVVDFAGAIAPDEVVIPSPAAPGQFITGDVLVTAAALLAPKAGQLVRFRAVQPPAPLKHLTAGVIAFSGAGDACAAQQMGATLGGDRFTVLWDAQLVALVAGARPAAGAVVRVARGVEDDEAPAHVTGGTPPPRGVAPASPARHSHNGAAATKKTVTVTGPLRRSSTSSANGAAAPPAMGAIEFVVAPVTRRRDVCTLGQLRQLHQRLADAACEDAARFGLAADRVADLVARAVAAPARGSWVTWTEVRRVLPAVVPRVPHYSPHVACRRKRRHSGSLAGCLFDRFVTAMLNRPVTPAELLESGISVLSAFHTHPFRMGCVHGLGEDGNYLAKMIEEPERTYERLETYADLLLFATSPPSFPIKGGRSTCDVVIRRWQVALGVHPKALAPQKAFIRELNVPHDILRKYPLATRAAAALEAVNFGLPNVARFLLTSKPGADTDLGRSLHQKAFDACFGDGEVITDATYTEDEPEPPIPLKIDKPLLLRLQESEATLLASQPATTVALFERFNSGAASVKKPGPNDPPPGHQTRKQALHSIGAASPKEMRVFINDVDPDEGEDEGDTATTATSKPPTHYFCIYYRDNEADRETSSLRCGRAAWYFSRNPALQLMAIHSGFFPRGATKSNCKNLWTVVYAFDPTKLVGPTEYLAALDNELKVAVGVFGAKKRAGDAAKAVRAITGVAAFDDSATSGKRRMPHVGPLLTTADADYASPPREALRIDPVKARPAPAVQHADPSTFRSTAKSDFVPRSVAIKQPTGHASPPRAPETRTFQTTYGSTIAKTSK